MAREIRNIRSEDLRKGHTVYGLISKHDNGFKYYVSGAFKCGGGYIVRLRPPSGKDNDLSYPRNLDADKVRLYHSLKDMLDGEIYFQRKVLKKLTESVKGYKKVMKMVPVNHVDYGNYKEGLKSLEASVTELSGLINLLTETAWSLNGD